MSAGSSNSRSAGFLTRAHLAVRLSFPPNQARHAVVRLIAVSLSMDIEPQVLMSALTKLAKRYSKTLGQEFVSQLERAIHNKDVWMIYHMAS